MKTMELCFEDWESKMRQSGKREIKVESVVRLTLKVPQPLANVWYLADRCSHTARIVRHSRGGLFSHARMG